MKAVGPPPAGKDTAGELVDDHHLAVLGDHVVLVAVIEGMCPQALLQNVKRLEIGRVVEVTITAEQPTATEQLLRALHAVLGQRHAAILLVEVVVLVFAQPRDDLVDHLVLLARGLSGAADDQWRACLVDQDGVDLIDDRVVQITLHVVVDAELHVVAHVVEAKLVVLAVRDVALVRALLDLVALARNDDAGAQTQEAVELAHPLGVTTREVVVDRDHMNALALEPIQVTGKRGNQRLALAGLHLGDLALVQHDSADQLHVIVAHSKNALASLARHGVRGDHQVIDRSAVVDLLPELGGFAA